MPGIGVVTNPNSRHNRRRPDAATRLQAVLGEWGSVVATHDPADLHQVALAFRDREIDLLCLNGGDGTNHVTLTAFLRAYGDRPLPPIVFLRGGTMNTIARSCQVMRGTPERILEHLVKKRAAGQPFTTTTRHVLRVDDQYGFIFGNGLIANYLRYYYQGGDPSPVKAAQVLLRGIGSSLVGGEMAEDLFRPVECRVEADGRSWELTRFSAIGAATVTEIGLGFTPFFRTLEREGAFHALGIACSPAAFVADLWNVYQGRATRSKEILSEVCSRIQIRQPAGQAYIIDGDYHPGGEVVTLQTGPRLTIVQS